MIPEKKLCNGCNRTLEAKDFHKQKRSKDGLHCRCRECRGVKKRINQPVKDRLLENREIDQVTGCWNWTGETNDFGYGRINIKGKKIVVHRVAYEEFAEPIPEGVFLCHKCDNPKCFNPYHVFFGTHKDNMRDRDVKGRAAKKLTEKDVREILSSELIDAQLARNYGVNQATIHAIKNGHTWKHVTGAL